jgi:hypothetical protein
MIPSQIAQGSVDVQVVVAGQNCTPTFKDLNEIIARAPGF